VIGMASSLYKTRSVEWLLRKFIKTDMKSERQAIVDTIVSYKRYNTLTLEWNNHKTRTFKRVEWEYQKQAREIGYYDHLMDINTCITTNSKITDGIANEAIKRYEITPLELKAGFYQSNSKIIESLCHYSRDWTELGDPELKPILDYVNSSIDKHIKTPEQRAKTLVIVPGSGLGRIAHELATQRPSFPNVQSVEFSPVMYLANQFIYTDGPPEEYDLHPYIHTYSHHTSAENHTRSVKLKRHLKKPDNLHVNFADIRTFKVEDTESYDNVLVVTAFFIDTAQNLFEYFKAIEGLIGDKKGIWINIGPLKYGTAPKVEFTLEELRKLRKLRGWKDLDEPTPYGAEISGYLTDVKGLWQGYYGLGRWTSSYN
jgi:hypothetical protein